MECKYFRPPNDGRTPDLFASGHEMDIRDLKFDDDSFDVAIDKGPYLFACTFGNHG